MRIGVVGTGAISAAGLSAIDHWESYGLGGKCWSVDLSTGLPLYPVLRLPDSQPITEFTTSYPVDRAGELALHAAEQAVAEAGWSGQDFAILVGCSRGPTQSWEQSYAAFMGDQAVPPGTSPRTTLGSIGFALGAYFGTGQLVSSLSVTCSSGLHAVLHGMALLRSGMVKRVLVGGTEAPLTSFTLEQMRALRVYGRVDAKTQYACRPFASPPSGMVLGEGAAFLALETVEEDSLHPTLDIGFSRESGVSRTGITATGKGLQLAMRQAVAEGKSPDVVIAHAPGTKLGDAAELAAIRTVFGELADGPLVTSLKWATGHTFGASGPLALVAGVLFLTTGRVLEVPYASVVRRRAGLDPQRVLVNATGFGGNVVSVLLRQE